MMVWLEKGVLPILLWLYLSLWTVAGDDSTAPGAEKVAPRSNEGHASQLRLPTFLASHMVLQREPQKARIWGHAKVGANVTVTLNDADFVVFDIADQVDGSWMVELPSQPAGAGHTLLVSDGKSTITLQDVAFGDVYICSGQSNMEFTVKASMNAKHEIADSSHYPNLRLATVSKSISNIPQEDVGSKTSYIWARSSPKAVNGPAKDGGKWGVYSATCYFFGRSLYKSLDGKVPIGLVTSCWGGQRIETFSSADALADRTCGGLAPAGRSERFIASDEIQRAVVQAERDENDVSLSPKEMQIWNAMIHPLRQMRFSGVIWYQGEANVDDPVSYACRFPAMIADWRAKFSAPDLTFAYVELAALRKDSRAPFYPWMRAAQGAALALPHVGVASAIDLGDPMSPAGPIHSRRKQEVGRRLALTVRAMNYQDAVAQHEYSGPVLKGVELQIDPAHTTARVTFVPGTARGLQLNGTAACTECCEEPPFQVLTSNAEWVRASLASIRNQDELLLVTNVSRIYGIQYAWEGRPECALYNGRSGPEDHTSVPARPFKWCAYSSGKPKWTHSACEIPDFDDSDWETVVTKPTEDVFHLKNDTTNEAAQPSGLRLPTFVDSHMVLQRAPQQARIWGWATPGANVTATLGKVDVTVVTYAKEKDGSWSIDLPPQPAGDGHSIIICDGMSTIKLEDVAFGDVFLCSGQSNMEMTLSSAFNGTDEVADSINYPNIRLATVAMVTADVPMEDVASKTYYKWARSSPQAVTGKRSLQRWDPVFSATCYFFGRDLYLSMNATVPIGLVTSCWGGQKVETFSSADALADRTCGGTTVAGGDVVPSPAASMREPSDSYVWNQDGVKENFGNFGISSMQLWNAMIHPLLPMRFTGAVWYQGEANDDDAVSYACRFPAMITDWRLKFDLPDLTFLYVQLAGFQHGKTWPWVRAAQGAALQLPGVGLATAVDLSDPDSPVSSIHPRRKQEVGRRLALTMKAIQYRDPEAQHHYTGPILAGVSLQSHPTHSSVVIGFLPGTSTNLHLAGSAACQACCDEAPFLILNNSGNWTRVAHAEVQGVDEVRLFTTSPNVFGIRYAWEPRPECILYSGEGGPDDHMALPTRPFEWCAYPSGKPSWTDAGCLVPAHSEEKDYW